MHERYSIEVNEESVMIYGDLSIEEAYDYLSFFERKGFKSITLGHENSTISFRRQSIEQVEEEVREIEHKLSEKFYENCHEAEKKEHQKTRNRVAELESLVKTIMSEKSERIQILEKSNAELLKRIQLNKLEESEEIKKFLHGFSYRPPKSNEKEDVIYVTGIDTTIIASEGMTQEEKEEAYKKLIAIKQDPNGPQVPTLEELMEDYKNV